MSNKRKHFYIFILLVSFLAVSFARFYVSCCAEEEFDFEGSIKKAQSHLRQKTPQGSEAALYEIRRCFNARKNIPQKEWTENKHQFFNTLKALSSESSDEITPDGKNIIRSETEDICFRLAYDSDIPAAVQKEALFAYAAVSAQRGDEQKVIDLLCEAVKRYPNDQGAVGHVFFNSGKILERRNTQECCNVYRAILGLIPDSPVSVRCRSSLADIYFNEAEYDKALEEFEAVISLKSTALKNGLADSDYFQWVWLQIGRCNFFLNNYDKAVNAFKETLKTNPESRFARQAKTNIENIEKLRKRDCS